MMLPNNLASSVPSASAGTSAPSPIHAAHAEAGDNRPAHADYNLHPLTVHSLEHYVIQDDEDERFHVS